VQPGTRPTPADYAAGRGPIRHVSAGLLSLLTSGSSGGRACISLPDAITVENPTLLSLHYSLPRPTAPASAPATVCPSDLRSYVVTITTPGLADTGIDTVKSVRPAPGKTDGSSETAIAILPPASAGAAARSSPIRALLGGGWLLRTISGLPAGQATNLDPTVVLTLNALAPIGLTAACHTTTAIATATTFTFQKPWATVADGCPDLSPTQAGWLYTRLLAGTVNWHGQNATITITKPGLGTATFLYIG
jgi:hypothetical protein